MPYLTVQHLIHENLVRVFFSNVTLENTSEGDEDPCHIVMINTFLVGVSIWVTQESVAMAFGIPNEGLSNEHASYPAIMLILEDNTSNLPLHERLLHLFVSHFFRPIRLKHITIHQIDY